MLLLAPFVASARLAYLDKGAIGKFTSKWAPQFFLERVVSSTGLDAYVRAKIALREADGALLLTDTHDLFLIKSEVGVKTTVLACLWGTPFANMTHKVESFHALHEWYARWAPSIALRADLSCPQESQDWLLSTIWFDQ